MAKNAKKELSLEEKLQNALVADWEQPYALPENWVWTRLGEVVKIKRGASPRPIKTYITNEKTGVNWIKIGDTSTDKHVYSTKEKITKEGALKSVYVEKGSLLLSNSMSFGRPYILEIDGCIHDGWLAITTSKHINKDFLYYCLSNSKWYFESVAVGTAVRNLNLERVSGLPTSLPPLAEQERIVQRIESLFAKLDTAKELLEKALESFESRKSALLHQAFTGELTKAWREKHGVSMETWEEKTLSETDITIIDGDRGQNYPKKEEFSPSGFCLFLNTKNVTKKGFSFNKLEFISQEKDLLLRKGKLSRGDVVLTTRGTIGNIAFYDFQVPFEHMRINSGMVIFRFTKELLQNFFLLQFYSSHITNQISLVQSGSAQPQLPIKDLKKIFIKIPTLPEQEEIVHILDAQLQKEEEAKAHIQHSLEHIEHMKKAILARAFRGELGTNNPKDSHALDLLKEILEQK